METNKRCKDISLDKLVSFELGSEVGSVEIICYDANGSELETMTITPDNPSTVICFDDGGQILASRYLRFTWEK